MLSAVVVATEVDAVAVIEPIVCCSAATAEASVCNWLWSAESDVASTVCADTVNGITVASVTHAKENAFLIRTL